MGQTEEDVQAYEAALSIIEAYAGKIPPDELVDIARHGLLGHLEWLENWEPPA